MAGEISMALWLRPSVLGVLAVVLATPVAAQDSEAALAALAAESQPSEGDALAEARTETAAGDLLGAAATLERALLANPNAHGARLYYATTLCRLGDMQGARIEIAKLDRQAIDAGLWSEADQACGGTLARPVGAAEGESRRAVRGNLYAGLGWDSNVTGATRLEFDVPGGAPKEGGMAFLAGGRARGETASYTRTIGLYGAATAAWRRSISGPALSYSFLEGRLGVGHDNGRIAPEFGVVVRRLGLDGSAYSSELGGQLAFGFGRAGRLRITPAFELVDQVYFGNFPGPLANGTKAEASLTLDSTILRNGAVRLSVGAERKEADYDFFAYDAWRLGGAARVPVGDDGAYARAAATWRRLSYDRIEPSALRRHDKRLFAEGAFGVPVLRRDLVLEGAVSYTGRDVSLSNDSNGGPILTQFRDYHSVGVQGRLIAEF